jgi:hypothetical protein
MFVWKALLTQSPSPIAGTSTTSALGIFSAAFAEPPAIIDKRVPETIAARKLGFFIGGYELPARAGTFISREIAE